jgi:hypothetical protein
MHKPACRVKDAEALDLRELEPWPGHTFLLRRLSVAADYASPSSRSKRMAILVIVYGSPAVVDQ